jgi:integrase
VPWQDAPAFVEALRQIEGVPARALELLIYSGVRTGSIRTATGDQFHDLDGDNPTWVIPPELHKTGKHSGKPHIVGLSDAAVACLRKVEVVPGRRVFPIHEHALDRLHRRISKVGVPHGWRKSLRTWIADERSTAFSWEVAESVLQHQIANDVQRRYVLTTWEDQRRNLLQQWADFLTGKMASGENVVQLRA